MENPQNLNLQIVLAITGCIALLIGLFGGGVKAKEIEVPKIRVGARILSSLVGIALIGIAIRLPNPIQQAESTPTPTEVPAPPPFEETPTQKYPTTGSPTEAPTEPPNPPETAFPATDVPNRLFYT